jgi:DNA-binding response OmpR family regulator
MVARIRAVHRRTHDRAPASPPPSLHHVGPFTVDLQRRAAFDAAGAPVALTGAEFAALQTLLEAAGKAVSRERLSETALRRPWRAEDRSIDQLIFSLRRKLADDDRRQRLIQSVRGAGYVLVRDGAADADDTA